MVGTHQEHFGTVKNNKQVLYLKKKKKRIDTRNIEDSSRKQLCSSISYIKIHACNRIHCLQEHNIIKSYTSIWLPIQGVMGVIKGLKKRNFKKINNQPIYQDRGFVYTQDDNVL